MLRREVLPTGETVTDEAGDRPSPLPDSWITFLGGEKTVFTAEIDVEEEEAMDKTMKTPTDIECPKCNAKPGDACAREDSRCATPHIVLRFDVDFHHRERIDAAFRVAWDEMKAAIKRIGKMARGEE